MFLAVEPSLDDVVELLSGDNVDIGNVVKELEGLVNRLIENGQIASEEFSHVRVYYET